MITLLKEINFQNKNNSTNIIKRKYKKLLEQSDPSEIFK